MFVPVVPINMNSSGRTGDPTVRWTIESRASETVLRAVASVKDVHPNDLDQTLYDAVDPDALDALAGEDGAAAISFTFAGCTVNVERSGTVEVEPILGVNR